MIFKIPVGGISAEKAKETLASLIAQYREEIDFETHIEKVKNILDKIKYNKHE